MTPLVISFSWASECLGQYLAYRESRRIRRAYHYLLRATARTRRRTGDQLAAAASTFLRPFLGFALVLALEPVAQPPGPARVVLARAHRGHGSARPSVAGRELQLQPRLWWRRSWRWPRPSRSRSPYVRSWSWALAATVVLVHCFGFRLVSDHEPGDRRVGDGGPQGEWSEEQVTDFFQIYASGPQMTAYLIEEQGDDGPRTGSDTRLLRPVSGAGASARLPRGKWRQHPEHADLPGSGNRRSDHRLRCRVIHQLLEFPVSWRDTPCSVGSSAVARAAFSRLHGH